MKTCPYCWEKIQDVAKKCRYCWERVNNSEENNWVYRISKPFEKEFVGKRDNTSSEKNYTKNFSSGFSNTAKKSSSNKNKDYFKNLWKSLNGLGKYLWNTFGTIIIIWLIAFLIRLIFFWFDDIWKHSDSPKKPEPILIEKNKENNYSTKTALYNTDNLKTDTNSDYVKIDRIYQAPENWTIIYKDDSFFLQEGWATLIIDNKRSNTDTIFKFVPNWFNKSVYTVYIRSWKDYTIKNIPEWYYKEYFASSRWKDQVWKYDMYNPRQFWSSESFYEDWYEITISLYNVFNWNVRSVDIWDETFDQL